jgi:hypothetical protein
VNPHWAKSENWRIAGALTDAEAAELDDLTTAIEQLVASVNA